MGKNKIPAFPASATANGDVFFSCPSQYLKKRPFFYFSSFSSQSWHPEKGGNGEFLSGKKWICEKKLFMAKSIQYCFEINQFINNFTHMCKYTLILFYFTHICKYTLILLFTWIIYLDYLINRQIVNFVGEWHFFIRGDK